MNDFQNSHRETEKAFQQHINKMEDQIGKMPDEEDAAKAKEMEEENDKI